MEGKKAEIEAWKARTERAKKIADREFKRAANKTSREKRQADTRAKYGPAMRPSEVQVRFVDPEQLRRDAS